MSCTSISSSGKLTSSDNRSAETLIFLNLVSNHGNQNTGIASTPKYPVNATKSPIDISPAITKFDPPSNVIAYAIPNPNVINTSIKL